jgi:nicotinamidase-related amidase
MTDIGPVPHNAWRFVDGLIDLAREPAVARPMEFPADPSPVRINLTATALVIVDMQKYFCEPGLDEDPESKASRRPIAPLSKLAPALRDASVPIVWVNWGNRPDQSNLPPGVHYAFNRRRLHDPQPFLTRGTPPAEIVDELAPDDGDIFVDKYRLSGFWDTPLDSILRGNRIDTLLFAGVNLDQCVYHTLADAYFLGYDCVLLSDCAATSSPGYCIDATLYNVKLMGFVAESTALMSALRSG